MGLPLLSIYGLFTLPDLDSDQTEIRTQIPIATLYYVGMFTLHGVTFRIQS